MQPTGARIMNAEASSRKLLIDTTQASQLLSLSPRTVWTLTARGDLPSVRIGRAVRYRIADVEQFVERQRRTATHAPERDVP